MPDKNTKISPTLAVIEETWQDLEKEPEVPSYELQLADDKKTTIFVGDECVFL